MYIILPYVVLKLSLLMRYIYPAAMLLLITHVGKALDILLSSRTLLLKALR
jgi:hypothetical protein